MDFKSEWKKLLVIAALFLVCFFLPVGTSRFDSAVMESLQLVKWYAREHVLLCLVPAFFIAGAIGVFVSQASVMRYLGAGPEIPHDGSLADEDTDGPRDEERRDQA